MKIELNRFTLPDIGSQDETAQRVLEIYSQIHPDMSLDDPEDRDRMLDELDSDQEVYVAQDEDGEPVGVMSYYFPSKTDSVYLSGIAVEPEVQGAGVAKIMIQNLVSTAREAGKTTIEGRSIPSAEAFHRHMGAVAYGDRFLIDLQLLSTKGNKAIKD